ncbi:DUF6538 domain-containing protein [Aurantimonas sp. VKM B-3413]|uniref:DUF6538 domain-containing protein n=1 Tax=Aurantimonas sp. VKM B-3413 TaxID=2779401 RepID=UPI001E5E7660|nr:DUF6538 domain-containing protein [Aurantimonas sp. VKM B-3413]MCB8837210.1 hypothetical protein [Aurantimonas sp. VKM B-3413]
MDDDSMSLPAYVTMRNGVYQYVRRIPEDLADQFSAPRIQRSLRTRLPGEARHRAAAIDREIEQEFDAARRRAGLEATLLPTAEWTWVEWEKVVEYLVARWLRDDLHERLRKATGEHFSEDCRGHRLWLDDRSLRTAIDLHRKLKGMTVSEYEADRALIIRRMLFAIGVPLPNSKSYREEFMSAALKAEVECLEAIFKREAGERIDHPHPDTIDGPWRRRAIQPKDPEALSDLASVVSPVRRTPVSAARSSRSLDDCIAEWEKERERLKKKVDPHLVADMRKTVERFTRHAGVTDVNSVQRHHVVRFRDSLFDEGRYKVATINKKIGFVTSLV